jgi:hypothetical protein
MAGSTVSETTIAMSATNTPPMPIEYRNRIGKTSSEASAAATVSELKSTVRPAVRSVRAIAEAPSPPSASSSR